ncbi:MAG: sigma-70 family RNA polymerase sigma factor [Gemmatales bacterium]
MKKPRPTLEVAADDTDEALLARFCQGEASAYGELLRRFQREIYSYLRRYLGQDALAEDVFQNTFFQVYQKARQFEAGRKVKPWLYAIATHQAIDMLRRINRRAAVSLEQMAPGDDEGQTWADTLHSSEIDPFDGLDLAERRTRVQEAIENLPEHLRLTVILAYYQGLKYQDIADIMKIPVGTVKSRLHAAMAKLHDALSPALAQTV